MSCLRALLSRARNAHRRRAASRETSRRRRNAWRNLVAESLGALRREGVLAGQALEQVQQLAASLAPSRRPVMRASALAEQVDEARRTVERRLRRERVAAAATQRTELFRTRALRRWFRRAKVTRSTGRPIESLMPPDVEVAETLNDLDTFFRAKWSHDEVGASLSQLAEESSHPDEDLEPVSEDEWQQMLAATSAFRASTTDFPERVFAMLDVETSGVVAGLAMLAWRGVLPTS